MTFSVNASIIFIIILCLYFIWDSYSVHKELGKWKRERTKDGKFI